MKRWLAVFMAVVLVLASMGCGKKEAQTADSGEAKTATEVKTPEGSEAAGSTEAVTGEAADNQEGKRVIGFCPPTMNNPFFYWIEQNVRKAVEAQGDTLITMDPQLDQQKQIEQVEDLLTQGIDALLLCPYDSNSIKSALVSASEKDVPIIIFDTPVVDSEYVETTVASDNYKAGAVVAEDLKSRLPEGSKIACLVSLAGETDRKRLQGFTDTLGDGYEIVAQLDGKGDTGVSLPLAEDILQAHPDLGAFFCGNDPSAIGAAQAIRAAQKTGEILVYGVDGSPEAKAAIKAKEMTGTGAQSPTNIAKYAVEAAYACLNGESLEENTVVPTFIINQDCIDTYGTEGWQ